MIPTTPDTNNTGRPTILIVDDEDVVRNAFQLYFETVGYQVTVANGGEKALEILSKRQGTLDVVLLDLVMPGMHGIDVLKRAKEIDGSVEVIIATGCGSMTSAIEALRHGAYDYVTKPVINLEEDLLSVVRGALAARNGRLGERGIQRKAPELDLRSLSTAREAEFYRGIETLVLETAGQEPDHREGALGEFLSHHLDATAAMAISQGKDDRLTCLAQWGELAKIPQGPLLDLGVFIRGRLLSSPSCWVRLEPGSVELPGHTAAHLDAIFVPLLYGPERSRDGNSEESSALIVLRAARGCEPPPPPGTAILGFVAGSILAARMVHEPSSLNV